MSLKYPHMLAPLKVGKRILKNRLCSSNSLPHFLQGPEPYPADSVRTHLMNRAKNGAAIVTAMGINNFSRNARVPMEWDVSHFPDYDLYDPNCQNYLLQLADGIHFFDSIACMGTFVGPSSAYPLLDTPERADDERLKNNKLVRHVDYPSYSLYLIDAHKDPRDYDGDTLELIAESYAEQARILKFLGWDMISIHLAYRGQLPSKFLSPLTNRRVDEFGGKLENRAAFGKMIFRKIREAVGPDFIVECLLSGEEPEGGYSLKDCADFLKMIEDDLDIVQLRGPEVDVSHPTGFMAEETPFVHFGEFIKKSGVDVLVAVIGGFQNFSTCEKVIAEGKADLISMARSWVSNPDYGKLAYEGRDEDMVPCLRCNKCHGRGKEDPFVSICAVNPLIGIEHMVNEYIGPPEKLRKIAIIGGGPAGMKAAIELADRNHEVTIFEAQGELGGAIKHSDHLSFKWPLRNFKNYLIGQVEKRNIKVELNRRINPEDLDPGKFDTVITALGAAPVIPPLRGVDLPQVVTANEAIYTPEKLGKKIVVIGGGEVGVEVGMHLAEKGHHVTVLEMRDELASDTTLIHYRTMFEEAWESLENFHSMVSVTCTAIEEDAVCYFDASGKNQRIEADNVVISTGMKARSDEAMKFYGLTDRFYMIGDCRRAATLESAMRSAYAVAARV